jgi:hypothetical protein
VSSLGAGRPRDLCSAGPNTHAVQQPEMREVLQQEQEAHCLVVATSAGQMLVLSANQLEEQGLADAAAIAPASAGSSKDKERAEDKTSAAEKSMLSSNQLRAEPRLTAVVAWNPAAAAAVAGNIVLCCVVLCCVILGM